LSKYYLYQDERKCIACRSCQVQCKVNKGLGVGPKLSQIVEVGPVNIAGIPKANYVFLSCFHCADPWCMAACPNKAIRKRPQDGVIYIDQDRCAGCKSCIMACPWSAPQWDAKKNKTIKCDFCMDRIDAGKKPACVAACPTGSLEFVLTDQVPDTKRVRFAREILAGKVR